MNDFGSSDGSSVDFCNGLYGMQYITGYMFYKFNYGKLFVPVIKFQVVGSGPLMLRFR